MEKAIALAITALGFLAGTSVAFATSLSLFEPLSPGGPFNFVAEGWLPGTLSCGYTTGDPFPPHQIVCVGQMNSSLPADFVAGSGALLLEPDGTISDSIRVEIFGINGSQILVGIFFDFELERPNSGTGFFGLVENGMLQDLSPYFVGLGSPSCPSRHCLPPELNIFAQSNVDALPEPGTLALLGVGLAGLGFSRLSRSMRAGRGDK